MVKRSATGWTLATERFIVVQTDKALLYFPEMSGLSRVAIQGACAIGLQERGNPTVGDGLWTGATVARVCRLVAPG